MQVFFATFVILIIAVIGMAVGVLLSNKRLKGSCGGLNAIGIEKPALVRILAIVARNLWLSKENPLVKWYLTRFLDR